MSVRGASKQIIDTLLTWEGMETHPHRFGGTEFRIGKREIGHIHGDSLVDIPFPKKVRDEIVAAGEARAASHFARDRLGQFLSARRWGCGTSDCFAQTVL